MFKNLFKNLTRKSFIIAGVMAVTYTIVLVGIFLIVQPFTGRSSAFSPANFEFTSPAAIVFDPYDITPVLMPAPRMVAEDDEGSLLRPPARTNFIFLGIDEYALADAIMVGTFYRDSGNIHLMSVPRDMYTRLPQHRIDEMRELGIRPPQSLKINAIRSIGGRNHGARFITEQLGEMFGVHFHYYVEVEMEAFGRIVDAIGGMTMYIPVAMHGYPVGNILPGYHHLDGATATNVVRFRRFPTGDIMRNQIQMEFMQQLIEQTLTRDALMNDPLQLASVVLNDVNTNATVLDIARFIPYFDGMSSDSVTVFTLPGSAQNRDGVSWFIPNASRLPDVINEVFYATQ